MGLFDALFGSRNKTTTTQSTSQTANNTSSTQIDPRIMQQIYANIDEANRVAGGWNPATITGPAVFTPDQLEAFRLARGVATAGQESTNQAQAAALAAAGYTPQQITAATYSPTAFDGAGTTYNAQQWNGPTGYDAQGYNAQGYQAVGAQSQGYDAAEVGDAQGYDAATARAAQLNRGQIRDISGGSTLDRLPSYLQGFGSTYQQGVIDSTLQDLDRARIMATQNNDAAAARAGAWGSRRDILDAETNRGFADAAARASAELRNQGYQTALGALSADQQRELAAAAANQNADTSVFGANANLEQTTNLANLDAANQAAQFRAQAQNQFALTNAEAENLARQFTANAANETSLANAAAATIANRDNAAATNAAREFGAGATNTARANSTALGAQVGLANSGAVNTANAANANTRATIGLANTAAANTAGAFNANSANQAAASNQAAGLTGNAQRLTAAGTLAGVGAQQQGMAVTGVNALNTTGTQQQAQNQAVIDVQNANAQNAANADLQRLGIRQSAMSGVPYGTTTTSSGTNTGSMSGTATTVATPSVIGAIGQIGGLVAGIASDKRLKKNVIRIGSPMTKVKRMTGVNYNWKDGGAPDSGLLAQDVEKAAPSAVRTINGVKHYNPAPVLGLLVEGMKELDRKVARR